MSLSTLLLLITFSSLRNVAPNMVQNSCFVPFFSIFGMKKSARKILSSVFVQLLVASFMKREN